MMYVYSYLHFCNHVSLLYFLALMVLYCTDYIEGIDELIMIVFKVYSRILLILTHGPIGFWLYGLYKY